MTHKYVSNRDRYLQSNTYQEIIGTQITELKIDDNTIIPLAATFEKDRITLFWWDSTKSLWQLKERLIMAPPIPNSKSIDFIKMDYSHNFSLFTGKNRVFLMYQHRPRDTVDNLINPNDRAPFLYVDIFEWDAENNKLDDAINIQVPCKAWGYSYAGLNVWGEWDEDHDKLLLVFQGIEVDHIFLERDEFEFEERDGFEFEEKPLDTIWEDPIDIRWYKKWQSKHRNVIDKQRMHNQNRLIFRLSRKSAHATEDLKQQASKQFHKFQNQNPSNQTRIQKDPRYFPGDLLGSGVSSSPSEIPRRNVSTAIYYSKLVVVRAELDETNNALLWGTPIELGSGGYDFDATYIGGHIHIIHREESYAFKINNIGKNLKENQQTPLHYSMVHFPLTYLKVNASNLRVDDSLSNIPGGEHPKIQLTTPLLITVNRICKGHLHPTRLKRAHKILLRHVLDGATPLWIESILFEFRLNAIRNLACPALRPYKKYMSEVWDKNYYFSQAFESRPIFLIARGSTDDKLLTLTFLMQVLNSMNDKFFKQNGSQLYLPAVPKDYLGRMEFNMYQGYAELTKRRIVDVNHLQITSVNGWLAREDNRPPNNEENWGIVDDWINPEDNIVTNGPRGKENYQFLPLTSSQTSEITANTIGGCLVAHQKKLPLFFYAYIDLGDGGLRVIHDARGIPSDLSSFTKEVSITDIVGPEVGDDEKILLHNEPSPTNIWVNSHLPSYDYVAVGIISSYCASLGSGFQYVLDILIDQVRIATIGPIDPDPYTVLFTQEINDRLQNDYEFAIAAEYEVSSVGDPSCSFTLDHAEGWPTTLITAMGHTSLDEDSVQFHWDINGPGKWVTPFMGDILDIEPVWQGQDIDLGINSNEQSFTINDPDDENSVLLPQSGRYQITLTVTDEGGESTRVVGYVSIAEIWDPLWEVFENIKKNDDYDGYEIPNAELSLGRYKFEFRTSRRLDPEDEDFDEQLVTYVEPTYGDDSSPRDYYGDAKEIFISPISDPPVEWLTKYKFRHEWVDYKFRINFYTGDIRVTEVILENHLKINNIYVSLDYQRPFTLGVLMRDYRREDSLGLAIEDFHEETLEDYGGKLPSALCAKPIGNTKLNITNVEVDLKLVNTDELDKSFYEFLQDQVGLRDLVAEIVSTFLGDTAGGIAGDLADFVTDTSFDVADLTDDWSGTGPVLTESDIANIEQGLKEFLEAMIKKSMKKTLKNQLDDTQLIWYAGEGLAESIALRVLNDPTVLTWIENNLSQAAKDKITAAKATGRSRFLEQFWQMVTIVDGVCAVTFRKNVY